MSSLALRIPASDAAPRVARHEVVDVMGLHGTLAANAALLVSEAVTNSVLHAGLGTCDVVHVDAFWVADGGLRVEVCDEGGGLRKPSSAGPRDGGHGLNLIGHLARRWGVVSDGHTRIWFELAG
ncbi:MAG: regulatory protein [Solirubrobacterales bacterium]|jgi:anti-sigma regulatory factor (Ser/Thr protein kinase)|nr:regulatory protein [Solirubrobacterales bacterium]